MSSIRTDGVPTSDRSFDPDDFVRRAASEIRVQRPRSERWTDIYLVVVIGAALLAWGWGFANALHAQVVMLVEAAAPSGALHREAAPWLGPGAPVVGAVALFLGVWGLVLRTLLAFGPLGIDPVRAFWVWRLPTRPAGRWSGTTWVFLSGSLLCCGGTGVCLGFMFVWLGQAPWWVVLALLAVGCLGGVACFFLAVRMQARRAEVTRAGDLPGWELRRAGTAARHLRNSALLASGAGMREALDAARARRQCDRSAAGTIPPWVRGPCRALLYATYAAEDVPRAARSHLTAVAAVLLALVLFSQTVLLAAWAALLVIAFRGLRTGTAYTGDVASGSAAERLFPLTPTASAWIHLTVPCVVNAVILGTTSLLTAIACQVPAVPLALLGLASGVGVGATGVRRMLSPPPDPAEPPAETVIGPVPRGQLSAAFRGVPAVLLLSALIAVTLMNTALWPATFRIAAVLVGIALLLALRTGRRV